MGAADRVTRCEGYRVDGAGGRIGFVAEVRTAAGGSAVLAVRAGQLGRRLILFPLSEVAAVVPRAKQVRLRPSAVPVGSEPLRDGAWA